jgi:hypothetical protein
MDFQRELQKMEEAKAGDAVKSSTPPTTSRPAVE